MLVALIIPMFCDPNRYRQLQQRIHQESERTPFWQYVYAHFVALAHEQPWCWLATVLFLLSLISLPWFRAEFIPSAPSPSERYGTFYLWGLKFANEWIPLADTWMFAVGQIWLDVGVFMMLFAWQSMDPCAYSRQKPAYERPWCKGLQVIFWLWRVSELVALGSFYGGIKTLVLNVLVIWMLYVGYVLGWGKFGVFTSPKHQPFVCICGSDPNIKITSAAVMTSPEVEIAAASVTAAIEVSEESSGSTSSTPYNGSPRTKNRKRSRQRSEEAESQ
ncbi:hypothetical protein BX666DRAFT_1265296 [Dichotomocladium elegans]|nr:hypothetical protein BX666DRAFT_1265296 [Dichotomocladium elegans]